MKKFCDCILVLLVLTTLSGCSVLGQASKGYLIAANQAFTLQPKAVRDAQPNWIKSAYFSTELLVSPIESWRLRLNSPESLADNGKNGWVQLQFVHDGELYQQQVQLVLEAAGFDETRALHWYVYRLAEQAGPFWQQYQEKLFLFAKPKLNFLLQPEFPQKYNSRRQSLDYQYAASFGLLSLGQMIRLNMAIKDKDFARLCEQDHYYYDKKSACGSVAIVERSAETAAGADQKDGPE